MSFGFFSGTVNFPERCSNSIIDIARLYCGISIISKPSGYLLQVNLRTLLIFLLILLFDIFTTRLRLNYKSSSFRFDICVKINTNKPDLLTKLRFVMTTEELKFFILIFTKKAHIDTRRLFLE